MCICIHSACLHSCIHTVVIWHYLLGGDVYWKTSYPTIDPVDMLKYLEQGHRLEKPTNSAAASEMYVDLKIYLLLSIW